MFFFTADEHYGHENIIVYCNRPFDSAEEMNEEIIKRHNINVTKDDIVIHAGDFTLSRNAEQYIKKLNGSHIFVKGSHDYHLFDSHQRILELELEGQFIVVCHYAMRVWHKSHFNSWQVFGHSHGRLVPIGKQWDVGVDNNNFTPVSFEKLKLIMENRPSNPNYIPKERRR